MPNAIVMNTMNGAVSEYSGFEFHNITPTHAGSAVGLYALGGDLDVAAKIISSVVTGKKLNEGSTKGFVDNVYFSLKGSGTSTLRVDGEQATYSYTFPVREAGVSMAKPGKGIRENYLAFGYSNTDGAQFKLDRVEVLFAKSTNRRV